MGILRKLAGGTATEMVRADVFMSYLAMEGNGSAAVEWTQDNPALRMQLVGLLYARILAIHDETRDELFRRVDDVAKRNVRDKGRSGFNFPAWTFTLADDIPPQTIWPWNLSPDATALDSPTLYRATLQMVQYPDQPPHFAIDLKMSMGKERIFAPASALLAIHSFGEQLDDTGRFELAVLLWQMNEAIRAVGQVRGGAEHEILNLALAAMRGGNLRYPTVDANSVEPEPTEPVDVEALLSEYEEQILENWRLLKGEPGIVFVFHPSMPRPFELFQSAVMRKEGDWPGWPEQPAIIPCNDLHGLAFLGTIRRDLSDTVEQIQKNPNVVPVVVFAGGQIVPVHVSIPQNQLVATQWAYSLRGERFGPLSRDKLMNKIVARELPENVWVWTKGMENWAHANMVPAFKDALPSPQPSAPQKPTPPQTKPAAPQTSPEPEASLGTLESLGDEEELYPKEVASPGLILLSVLLTVGSICLLSYAVGQNYTDFSAGLGRTLGQLIVYLALLGVVPAIVVGRSHGVASGLLVAAIACSVLTGFKSVQLLSKASEARQTANSIQQTYDAASRGKAVPPSQADDPLSRFIRDYAATFQSDFTKMQAELAALRLDDALSRNVLESGTLIRSKLTSLAKAHEIYRRYEALTNTRIDDSLTTAESLSRQGTVARNFFVGFRQSSERVRGEYSQLFDVWDAQVTELEELLTFLLSRQQSYSFEGETILFLNANDLQVYNTRFSTIQRLVQRGEDLIEARRAANAQRMSQLDQLLK